MYMNYRVFLMFKHACDRRTKRIFRDKFDQIKNFKIVFHLWPLIGNEFLLKYVFVCSFNIEKLTAHKLCFTKYWINWNRFPFKYLIKIKKNIIRQTHISYIKILFVVIVLHHNKHVVNFENHTNYKKLYLPINCGPQCSPEWNSRRV